MKNIEEKTIKRISIVLSLVMISVVVFVVSYTLFNNNENNDNQSEGFIQEVEIGKENTAAQIVSSSIGKSVNEVNVEETNKPSNLEKREDDEKNSETSKVISTNVENENTNVETNMSESEEEVSISFITPVEGEIIKEFAVETLVYSETLQEWTTHNGIDIKAEKSTIVKASAGGRVKSIKNDPRYGLTAVIQHSNGFETVYSNLLTAEFIVEGEEITQGQSIGTVGNTATFEIADPTHLHFEILKNSIPVDPSLYF